MKQSKWLASSIALCAMVVVFQNCARVPNGSNSASGGANVSVSQMSMFQDYSTIDFGNVDTDPYELKLNSNGVFVGGVHKQMQGGSEVDTPFCLNKSYQKDLAAFRPFQVCFYSEVPSGQVCAQTIVQQAYAELSGNTAQQQMAALGLIPDACHQMPVADLCDSTQATQFRLLLANILNDASSGNLPDPNNQACAQY